ncbi:serine protease [Vibrio tubiashii]|uniref:Trypsin n=1 Tax=Vibrio tubiashii ATCC 19109 TaxID=1051646 RepID=F9T054_9VIBR|nr:serine protease [Vibrio tubiashii]AIW13907.1 trypsin [Vibrio tubiashii ATCC 19109]EGU58945.1 trypsin [Vibrio tubiashii ATCC 19109]EIF03070.1 serine protease [Vibrio tubiashii NCIMB 1337 = ATCC 19106]
MSRWSIPLALSCSGLITASAVATEITPYIINGTNASQSDWPYITALVKKNQNAYDGQFCGASFIGQRYILTAAHCVDDFAPDDFDVIVGINNLNSESSQGARISVNKVYIHPQFNASSLSNDIAVLELSRVVTSNEATPATLPTSTTRNNTSDGTILTVAGWGSTTPEYGNHTTPAQLQQLDVPLVNQTTCSNTFATVSTNTSSPNFCAGTVSEGYDSCRGDSGGPIIVKATGTQLGLVSFGKQRCGEQNSYGVYTNLSEYMDFIAQHTSGISYDADVFAGYSPVGQNFTHTFRFTNYGASPVTYRSLVLGGGSAVQSNNTCSTKGTLASGESCEATISFTVSAYAQYSRTYTLNYQLNGNDYAVESKVSIEGADRSDGSLTQALAIPSVTAYSNNHPWQVYSGAMLRTAPISHLQTSALILDGLPAGSYRFDVKLSTETADKLYLYINGDSQGGISGIRELTHQMNLNKVSNRIKLEYVKDSSIDEGDDAAYISNLRRLGSTTTATPPATASSSSGGGGGGSLGWLSIGLLALVARRRK